MKKIIHLSDLHIGHGDSLSRFRSIVTNISCLKKPASNYVIVISGDLVDDGRRTNDGYIWNGYWKIPCAFDGGTSTRKGGKPGPHRVIDLSRKGNPSWYDGGFLRHA